MQHSNCNSPSADMLSPFNNTSMVNTNKKNIRERNITIFIENILLLFRFFLKSDHLFRPLGHIIPTYFYSRAWIKFGLFVRFHFSDGCIDVNDFSKLEKWNNMRSIRKCGLPVEQVWISKCDSEQNYGRQAEIFIKYLA